MKKTEHYQLNQWELSDRIMVEDFNKDNETIDGALAGKASLNEFLSFQQSAAADLAALQQSTAADLEALRQSASADLAALRQSISAEITALQKSMNKELTALEAGLAAAGNCRIATGSYVGNGTYGSNNPTTLTFPFQPKLFILNTNRHSYSGSTPIIYLFYYGVTSASSWGDTMPLTVSWNGNTVSWFYPKSDSTGAKYQFNNNGVEFHYIVIG